MKDIKDIDDIMDDFALFAGYSDEPPIIEKKITPVKEESIYCSCSQPEYKKVWLIVSQYDFCTKCKKERKS